MISDHLEDIRQENPHLFENINLSLGVSAKSIPLKSLSHADKDSKDFQNINEVKCVFCHVDKLTNKDSNFVIHPYVSKNFRNKSIYMCSTCIESWHVYRQTAQEENSLMLPGENNEELCAICSDTPEVGPSFFFFSPGNYAGPGNNSRKFKLLDPRPVLQVSEIVLQQLPRRCRIQKSLLGDSQQLSGRLDVHVLCAFHESQSSSLPRRMEASSFYEISASTVEKGDNHDDLVSHRQASPPSICTCCCCFSCRLWPRERRFNCSQRR